MLKHCRIFQCFVNNLLMRPHLERRTDMVSRQDVKLAAC